MIGLNGRFSAGGSRRGVAKSAHRGQSQDGMEYWAGTGRSILSVRMDRFVGQVKINK